MNISPSSGLSIYMVYRPFLDAMGMNNLVDKKCN